MCPTRVQRWDAPTLNRFLLPILLSVPRLPCVPPGVFWGPCIDSQVDALVQWTSCPLVQWPTNNALMSPPSKHSEPFFSGFLTPPVKPFFRLTLEKSYNSAIVCFFPNFAPRIFFRTNSGTAKSPTPMTITPPRKLIRKHPSYFFGHIILEWILEICFMDWIVSPVFFCHFEIVDSHCLILSEPVIESRVCCATSKLSLVWGDCWFGGKSLNVVHCC